MTAESTSASLVPVATTATGITQIAGENTGPSPSPAGIEFYFQIAVLVIGVLGTAANAVILYALVASKEYKTHVLIVHQNALDLFTSFSLVVIYSTKLCNVSLAGSAGYWLCTTILSESLSWWGTIASAINLAVVTVERYLKVVHPVWCKKKLRNWMTYSAMATAWIISFMCNVAAAFPTSGVIDGVCYPFVLWKDETVRMFYFLWNIVSFYVVILFIFVFCYWRIVLVIRRQTRVMASHAASGSTAAQNQWNQIQSKVIKLMIFVSACYAVSWLPFYVHFTIVMLAPPLITFDGVYYATVLLAYSYMCTNPFIYATKLDPVREVLLGLIPCKKTAEPSADASRPIEPADP